MSRFTRTHEDLYVQELALGLVFILLLALAVLVTFIGITFPV